MRSKHVKTLEKIFEDPVRTDIHWFQGEDQGLLCLDLDLDLVRSY